jgi:hypothetical protein
MASRNEIWKWAYVCAYPPCGENCAENLKVCIWQDWRFEPVLTMEHQRVPGITHVVTARLLMEQHNLSIQ